MKKIKYILSALVILSLNSCSDDDEINKTQEEVIVKSINVVCESFDDFESTSTRINLDISKNKSIYYFRATDTLGIYPSKGDQLCYPLSGSAGQTSATFDGGGWKMKDGYT